MSTDSNETILIILMHGIPTVWSERECCIIRKHRIMGSYVGPLPKFCQDKDNFGLPLRLMKAEAKLLIDKEIAKMAQFSSVEELKSSKFKLKYEMRENEVNEEQSKLAFEERKAEILKMSVKILNGKKKKMAATETVDENEEEFDIEHIINEEISRACVKDSKFVEICMEHPFLSEISLKTIDWNYPEAEEEQLTYCVYKDLWEKNYTITSGIKFGGDYLAYQGDPNDYHASFIIKCVDHEREINSNDMITWIRIGTITKKSLVLASLDDGSVCYQSFHWPNDELKKMVK